MELDKISKGSSKKKSSKRDRSSSSDSEENCKRKRHLKESKPFKKLERKKKRKKKLKNKKKGSESEMSSSSSDLETELRKKKRKKKKKSKIKERETVKQTQESNLEESKMNEGQEEYNVISGPMPEKSVEKPKQRTMVPMTQEEYQKQQSKVKRVFDPDSGRERLVKGDGEIVEEVVSYNRHKAINKLSTLRDGAVFQKSLGLNKYTDKIYQKH